MGDVGVDADVPLETAGGVRLRPFDERHDDAGGARTRGAAGSVNVRCGVLRRIEVDDAGDTVDVHTTGGDVGCDQ